MVPYDSTAAAHNSTTAAAIGPNAACAAAGNSAEVNRSSKTDTADAAVATTKHLSGACNFKWALCPITQVYSFQIHRPDSQIFLLLALF